MPENSGPTTPSTTPIATPPKADAPPPPAGAVAPQAQPLTTDPILGLETRVQAIETALASLGMVTHAGKGHGGHFRKWLYETFGDETEPELPEDMKEASGDQNPS